MSLLNTKNERWLENNQIESQKKSFNGPNLMRRRFIHMMI